MPSSERPVGIVAMPSTRHPQLIYSLASELARIGQMRFMGALEYSGAPPRSGPGGNSAYRFADVRDAFVVPSAMGEAVASAPGPLLLVDDVVDSRWSITSATATLRQAGAPGVLPFALAVVG